MRWILVAGLLLTLSLSAQAAEIAEVEVFDLTTNQSLPIHDHRGRRYVIGEPRHQYELRIHNRATGRVLAVTSVDGVNVVTGKTAAEHQSGYLIETWSTAVIAGWRKNLHEVATFYFTRLEDSYAARTHRPDNVGVIGVALFRERAHCCTRPREQLSKEEHEARAPSSPGYSSSDRATNKELDSPTSAQRSEPRLGTGHGHREHSPAQYVDFERASMHPDETILIYYDSYRNLLAQGIVPSVEPYAHRAPQPFPDGFVQDP
jgi:hypothetical protein